MLASLAMFSLGVIYLWLDVLDPPNNPLPGNVIFLERFADRFIIRTLPHSMVPYVSAVYAALFGLGVAVIIDAAVTYGVRILRRATI